MCNICFGICTWLWWVHYTYFDRLHIRQFTLVSHCLRGLFCTSAVQELSKEQKLNVQIPCTLSIDLKNTINSYVAWLWLIALRQVIFLQHEKPFNHHFSKESSTKPPSRDVWFLRFMNGDKEKDKGNRWVKTRVETKQNMRIQHPFWGPAERHPKG